ncbi:hypothetical protein OG411_29855 [Streptomyces pseudogriseolus]|uniref:hypothetical protein n=1 Tax=Streptomyces pseudogriseolus TaxID=36817 RepID=UPI003255DC05
MTDQKTPESPQERPEGGSAVLESPEGQNGPQAGAESLDVERECDDDEDAWDGPLVPAALMDAIHQAEAQQKQDEKALAELPFAGPSIRECAEADRRWPLEKHGE